MMCQLLCILILLSALSVCDALARSQPWPLKVDRHGVCCSRVFVSSDDSENLTRLSTCLNEVDAQRSDKSSFNISFVTLAQTSLGEHGIADIHQYAPWQRAVVSAYCEHRGYGFRFFDHHNVSNMIEDTSTDPRWLKIAMLSQALNTINGWARRSNALVWIGENKFYCIFCLKCMC